MEEKKATPNKPKRKNALKRTYKALLWMCASIVILILLLLGAVAWILTPERITPIVEKYANEYLDAKVNVGKVELTFWKTFPQLRIDVDSLSVVSDNFNILDNRERATLPVNADTLLSLGHFHGGIGVTALMSGEIEIYEVELRQPMVNLVQYNDTLTNFDIIPASEPDTATASQMSIPKLTLDRFIIADALPISYTSIADSMSIGVTLGTTYLDGNDAPLYEIALNADAKALLPPTISESSVPVGLNGGITWNPDTPHIISLNDFAIDVSCLHSILNTTIDMGEDLIISSLDYRIERLPIAEAMKHIPQEYRPAAIQHLNTDLTVNGSLRLAEPYNTASETLPVFDATIDLPKGRLQFGDRHKPLHIAASIAASINGRNLNASTLAIKSLTVNGASIDVSLDGTVSSPLKDPAINANFKGKLNFNNLPPIVLKQIPGEVHGSLSANTSLKLRQSHLNKTSFHKAKVSGSATLHNFSYTDSSTNLYAQEATFKFGTSNSFVTAQRSVDSLLTASIKIDTARVNYSGTRLMVKNLRAGIGCKNTASSIDSTQVNPITGTFRAERINLRTSDSTRVRLRDLKCMASMRRYKEDNKIPELKLVIDAKRVSYGDNLNRLNMREGNINITAHLKKRRKMSAAMQNRYDSIAKHHPDLASDSLLKLTWASMRGKRRSTPVSDKEIMDFALDNTTKNLLRRWNVHGTITAKSGRMFTPYFPLRNSLRNINVGFTTDSLTLDNITYKVGRSDFLINGSIRNISRALTSRRGSPLYLDFSVRSDTVDVNQLAEAIFTGAAFTADAGISLDNIENDDSIQSAIEQMQDTTQSMAVLVPTNIEANIRLRAHNVIYADMLMKRMRGIIMMKEGALNMHNLTASTDIGTIGLSALYTAPSKKDLSFGFGLQVKDLHLNRFINMIPAVDSLMPMLKNFEGIIDADIAATTAVDTAMNLVLPTLNAAIKLHGDSLVLLDAETFKSLSKWLMFKNKKRNMIDNMTVEILVENSMLELFPFMFDIDRYRLGIMGSNDMAFNFNYHVSVLKSPLPFKFGLTVSGNADDMKVRVGKAKFKENMVGERVAIVDTTRVNLLNQIENVFRRGVATARLGNLKIDRNDARQGINDIDTASDTISHADSLLLIKEGLLPAPPPIVNQDKPAENK